MFKMLETMVGQRRKKCFRHGKGVFEVNSGQNESYLFRGVESRPSQRLISSGARALILAFGCFLANGSYQKATGQERLRDLEATLIKYPLGSRLAEEAPEEGPEQNGLEFDLEPIIESPQRAAAKGDSD